MIFEAFGVILFKVGLDLQEVNVVNVVDQSFDFVRERSEVDF